MACFVTPTVAAIIATTMKKKIDSRWHFNWLLQMLWGGVLMLIVDHLISGELSVYPPFLTALKSPEETIVMFKEMFVVGGLMTAVIFVAWGIMVFVANKKEVIKYPVIK